MVVFFALIGYMRGWQKEVIALSGLVGAIAALQQFGYDLVAIFGATIADQTTPEQALAIRRQQFWIQSVFFIVIAFFSYQVVARLASQIASGRLGERLRAGLEKRIIGSFIGAINGYLLIGGLWSFLEYQPQLDKYVQLAVTEPYPFDTAIIARPIFESSAMAMTKYLSLGVLSPTMWLVLFFVTFFIVIIALV
jgi:uncharacterized membrane protein required for colicin V production